VHNAAAPGLGRVGVLVALESAGNVDVLNDIGRKVAMHVAATSPLSVSVEEIPAEAVAREKAILTEQAKESGKPANVIEKMIEGRLRKFYEEVVLTKQAFVLNPDQTVEAAVKEAEKAAGAPIKLASFIHFRLGEGVEKKVDDFAAEVAATASGGR
jgi:elongation factor Ts